MIKSDPMKSILGKSMLVALLFFTVAQVVSTEFTPAQPDTSSADSQDHDGLYFLWERIDVEGTNVDLRLITLTQAFVVFAATLAVVHQYERAYPEELAEHGAVTEEEAEEPEA